MPTIVLTGGGSGGHITPLLSLAHALKTKDPGCRIIYFGLKGEKIEGLQERYQIFDDVRFVPSGKYRRYHGQNFFARLIDVKTLTLNVRDFFRVLAGIQSSKRQLRHLNPNLVFSKGSYVAVPVGVAAHRLGIPIITHDSDAVPGLANRILGRWAAAHAVGQPPENYNYPKDKTFFTGIPVDERIKPVSGADQEQYKKELGLPVDGLALLVTGGGLGSGSLNLMMAQIIPHLLQAQPKLMVVIVTGSQHEKAERELYASMPEAKDRVRIIGFTPDFYKLSGAADLILCRAGASTLAEFAIQGKACVIIPAAQLAGGHQLANVRQLKSADAAEVLDSDVQTETLFQILNQLLQNKQRREQLGAKLATLAQPQASDKLADLILYTIAGGAAK